MKFVDVRNDVAFHKIFGDANRSASLISFLNAIMRLEGQERIKKVTIENPYQFPAQPGGKSSILDISATDKQGRKFIVELQVADKKGFDKRVQFYTARDYSAQIVSGDDYPQLRPTHFIGILYFDFTQNPHYYSQHQTRDVVTGEHLLKDMQYFFLELNKFNKAANELKDMIDKWAFFLKFAKGLSVIPPDVKDKGLKEAYIGADMQTWTKQEIDVYIKMGVYATDEVQELLAAEEKGVKKNQAETINKLHQKGKTAEEIADLLDISVESVKNLIAG